MECNWKGSWVRWKEDRPSVLKRWGWSGWQDGGSGGRESGGMGLKMLGSKISSIDLMYSMKESSFIHAMTIQCFFFLPSLLSSFFPLSFSFFPPSFPSMLSFILSLKNIYWMLLTLTLFFHICALYSRELERSICSQEALSSWRSLEQCQTTLWS